jgi:hypothetical protein
MKYQVFEPTPEGDAFILVDEYSTLEEAVVEAEKAEGRVVELREGMTARLVWPS